MVYASSVYTRPDALPLVAFLEQDFELRDRLEVLGPTCRSLDVDQPGKVQALAGVSEDELLEVSHEPERERRPAFRASSASR